MLRVIEYFVEAFDSLMRNKLRAILTMLGIVIGVTSVDSVFALSSATAASIDRTTRSGNLPTLMVVPDPQAQDPARARLSYHDATVVFDSTQPVASRVVPFYSALASMGNRAFLVRRTDQTKTHVALAFSFHAADDIVPVTDGRSLNENDQRSALAVAVISPDLATDLFGNEHAGIGRFIIVHNMRVQIVGIVDGDSPVASNFFVSGNPYIVFPFSTFHRLMPGNIDGIYAWAASPDQEDQLRSGVLSALRHLHGEQAQYRVTSFREMLQQREKTLNIVAASLTAIGAISLFVAGIGIMNIMLVAVSERTREIGIRKSIGASQADIIIQFLFEAILMSLMGGVLGLLLSMALVGFAAGALSHQFEGLAIAYGTIALLAFLFSLLLGVIFGVYPAFRASKLDPVEALRS